MSGEVDVTADAVHRHLCEVAPRVPQREHVVARGKLELTAIAAHIHDKKGNSQDLVYKLSTAGDRLKLLKTYLVGNGELVTGSGVTSSAPRFDFSTITFLQRLLHVRGQGVASAGPEAKEVPRES